MKPISDITATDSLTLFKPDERAFVPLEFKKPARKPPIRMIAVLSMIAVSSLTLGLWYLRHSL